MNDNRSAIRVGLIGYGFAGKTFHAPLIAAAPDLALVAVASSKPDAVRADLPSVEIFADPVALAASGSVDLIVVASPNDTHAPLAAAALKAGAHVVVDKPFTLTLDEARDLAALAEAEGKLLSVFHNRRYDTDFLGIRNVIESGVLGRIVHFETHFDRFRPAVRDRWRERAVPGGGLWFDLGPHLIDQTLQLLGLPERVTATIATQREGGQAADYAHVILDYGTARAILHGSMLVAGGVNRFTVHGEKGSVVKRHLDPQEPQLLSGMRPGLPGWGKDDDQMILYDGEREQTLPVPAGDQSRYYRDVARAIRGEGANPVTPHQALAVMAVLEAAVESSDTGRTVALPLTDKEKSAWL
ncbi:oxidoreductase [Rhizobiaceae bacterium BDR2-2]|uniref:Oxidoreductase n=1 Tax=Ectorhizobium quercum TaxID=2965071 RepID=A0AAE3N1K0_9HYPH|nr:oxidoreductase [Ectorhizobium quercum]MCX8998251.1 oxidoreductase [Ectorhizobium quercum]